jgi:hypothetical protein
MQKAPPEMGSSSDKQPDTRSMAIPPPGQSAPAFLCSNGFRIGPGKIGATDAVHVERVVACPIVPLCWTTPAAEESASVTVVQLRNGPTPLRASEGANGVSESAVSK